MILLVTLSCLLVLFQGFVLSTGHANLMHTADTIVTQIRSGYIPRSSNYSFEAMQIPSDAYRTMMKRIVAVLIQEYVTLGTSFLGMQTFALCLGKHLRMFLPGSSIIRKKVRRSFKRLDMLYQRGDMFKSPYGIVLHCFKEKEGYGLLILEFGTSSQRLFSKKRSFVERFTYPNRPELKHRRFASLSTGIYYAAVGDEIPSTGVSSINGEKLLLEHLSIVAFIKAQSPNTSISTSALSRLVVRKSEFVYTELHRTKLSKDARLLVPLFAPLQIGTIVAYDESNVYVSAAPILFLTSNCLELDYVAAKHIDEPQTDGIDLINKFAHTDTSFRDEPERELVRNARMLCTSL